jgi:hypothetical protein
MPAPTIPPAATTASHAAVPWWGQTRGLIAIAAGALAVIAVIAFAARPDPEPTPTVDPAAAFDTLRASLVPASKDETPIAAAADPSTAAQAETTPPPATPKRTTKKRTPKKPAAKKSPSKKTSTKTKG